MGARTRRAVVLGIVALLASAGLVSVGSAAVAEDGGNPAIVSPASSGRLYAGTRGPFVVEFANAATGSYTWSVVTVPGDVEVASGPVSWTGAGTSARSITTPSVLAAGDYSFTVKDADAHSASVAFEVVGYAQPRCTLIVPATIRVNAPEERVAGSLASDCAAAQVSHASWDVRRAGTTFYNLFEFSGTTQDYWKHTASDPLGTFVAQASTAATNPAGDTILRNSPSTTIRLASRVSLSAVRVRKYVTLRASLTRYVPAARAFRPWKGRVVTLSYKTCKSCAWHRLTARTTSSKGTIQVRVRAPKVRYYRASVAGTSTVWAPYADLVRR
ncbi:hypothetical protein EFK50_18485 [Nocardioides marmoriginsengisoli]|uniref:Uncharacterized protein n=1 Tax=Nocardioides marmoriginsengisoli TaxID=661483 RepID=A0A3N0CD08_9ACTN|nr:hypothetical protein [Nocardioides marmoriginsengisoli]RNL61344.1 hypothetical protein EFK50_18485 [Nocardioides marmoriginsengisoli]